MILLNFIFVIRELNKVEKLLVLNLKSDLELMINVWVISALKICY